MQGHIQDALLWATQIVLETRHGHSSVSVSLCVTLKLIFLSSTFLVHSKSALSPACTDRKIHQHNQLHEPPQHELHGAGVLLRRDSATSHCRI